MKISPALEFFIQLAKLQAIMARRFDSSLGGVSFNEFIILNQLNSAPAEKMRRSDLAERIGLTASGVTRLLLPMEKIGLVRREADEHDARVSFVALARGGKTKLAEARERAEEMMEEMLPDMVSSQIPGFTRLLTELGKAA